MSQSSATVLDRQTCLTLLATQSLGRLIFTHRALPDVLPVAYRVEAGSVLLRLSFGSFEADHIDPLAGTGWSVTIVGRAHELTVPHALLTGAALDLSSWAADARDLFFAVDIEKVTGHQLAGNQDAPA